MEPAAWKKLLLYGSVIIGVGILANILRETVTAKNTGFETKTLWDWMELLIIPLVLSMGVFYLNRSERTVDRQMAEKRAEVEREIATDRQREAALQAYLDRMAELLLKEKLRTSSDEEVRNVARIRTLTVLRGLDAKRKRMVFFFLHESGLIAQERIVDLGEADLSDVELSEVDLSGANLSAANLSRAKFSLTNLSHANLSAANLRGADFGGANLTEANLSNADLHGANLGAHLIKANLSHAELGNARLYSARLTEANLSYAYLGGADLNKADLSHANLSHASLTGAQGADLRDANLTGADLSEANLGEGDWRDIDLSGADLSYSNLRGAEVSARLLATAKSLQGATMPDGTKHE
jgi:uncharacterized protein YjbI with pentapeptide repeats